MVNSVTPGASQASSAAFKPLVSLGKDFNYDALGGVGRLGNRSVEALPPGTRQTGAPAAGTAQASGPAAGARIAGPEQTFGRWLDKAVDALTPATWRQQGKFVRSLEDFSAGTGRVLGHLHNLSQAHGNQTDLAASRKQVLAEVAQLAQQAQGMTRRGVDFNDVLRERVRVNLGILDRDPSGQGMLAALRELDGKGSLHDLIRSLDPATQGDLQQTLGVMMEEIRRPLPGETVSVVQDGIDADDRLFDHQMLVDQAPREAAPEPAPVSRHAGAAGANLLERIIGGVSAGQAARAELARREGVFHGMAQEARINLDAALTLIDQASENPYLPADPRSFSGVRGAVDEAMGQAIEAATNGVCAQALGHLSSPGALGVEGRDFSRISAQAVSAELRRLDSAVTSRSGLAAAQTATPGLPAQAPAGGEAPLSPDAAAPGPTDPFRDAIQRTRGQIGELSSLYGQMHTSLDDMQSRAHRYQACVLLRDMAISKPPSLSHVGADEDDFPGVAESRAANARRFVDECDQLIDLLTPSNPSESREAPSHPPGNLEQRLAWLGDQMRDHENAALRDRFMSALEPPADAQGRRGPSLARTLSAVSQAQPAAALPASSAHHAQLNYVERLGGIHRAIQETGALVQRSGLPQADMLSTQASQLSRWTQQLALDSLPGQGGPHGAKLTSAQRTLLLDRINVETSRFMASVAQARMQAINPGIVTGAPYRPQPASRPAAPVAETLEALAQMQRGVELLARDFNTHRNGSATEPLQIAIGRRLTSSAEAAARACAAIPTPGRTSRSAMEQLAVCMASSRADAAQPLRDLLAKPNWDRTPEHRQARQAMLDVIEHRDASVRERGQEPFLNSVSKLLNADVTVHDATLDFGGNIRLLINTNRGSWNPLTSSDPQGTKWVDLPPASALPPSGRTNLGIVRLDDMLSTGSNRVDFYPRFFSSVESHLNGTQALKIAR